MINWNFSFQGGNYIIVMRFLAIDVALHSALTSSLLFFIKSLREVEREFKSILEKQGGSMKQALRLVRENGDITRKISV
jgi:hypothetical protein